MKLRRLWAVLLICIVMLNSVFSAVLAEESDVPGMLTYQGGVVHRSYPRGASAGGPLELGYALANSPYIILDTPTVWEFVVEGGTGPYTCEALLAYQPDLSMDPFEDGWYVPDWFDVEANGSFTYTFTEEGRYFWEFSVTDAKGQGLVFQTRIYEAYTAEDETDPTTVVGKVNSIIAENITPGMSDYTRARVLHDWLIYNANYDYTYTNYDASGVLLYGSGVCDSYARAYLMLMTAAGVDCMIVSGSAGGGSHAWNLVKLGGSWYHVDCTWDDPNEGGYENHDYFCVNDETMALDHSWNRPGVHVDSDGMLVPEAGGEYESRGAGMYDYDFTFADLDELKTAFDREVAAGNYRYYTVGCYTGSGSVEDLIDEIGTWFETKVNELANQGLVYGAGYGYYGKMVYLELDWADLDDYIRIDDDSVRVDLGGTLVLYADEYYDESDAFVWVSSDPDVVSVKSCYTSQDGPYAELTGLAAGSATVTVTSADGLSDSVEVTVLSGYEGDFNLVASESSGTISLSWDLIPGATEYRVMLSSDGTETCLATASAGKYSVNTSALPVNCVNALTIRAVRVVGNAEAAVYDSPKIEHIVLRFASALPEGITAIEKEAFAGDAALDTLYIPDGAESIGADAFRGCTLTAVRIPGSVTSIGDGAFGSVRFAQLEKGSYADGWFAENRSGVTVVYE